MSTAKTTIGCLAEDYSSELRDICRAWLAQPGVKVAARRSAYVQRLIDVAESLILDVTFQLGDGERDAS